MLFSIYMLQYIVSLVDKEEDYVHDGRTLYERLKEQKDKKQEEFEEQLKFSLYYL